MSTQAILNHEVEDSASTPRGKSRTPRFAVQKDSQSHPVVAKATTLWSFIKLHPLLAKANTGCKSNQPAGNGTSSRKSENVGQKTNTESKTPLSTKNPKGFTSSLRGNKNNTQTPRSKVNTLTGHLSFEPQNFSAILSQAQKGFELDYGNALIDSEGFTIIESKRGKPRSPSITTPAFEQHPEGNQEPETVKVLGKYLAPSPCNTRRQARRILLSTWTKEARDLLRQHARITGYFEKTTHFDDQAFERVLGGRLFRAKYQADREDKDLDLAESLLFTRTSGPENWVLNPTDSSFVEPEAVFSGSLFNKVVNDLAKVSQELCETGETGPVKAISFREGMQMKQEWSLGNKDPKLMNWLIRHGIARKDFPPSFSYYVKNQDYETITPILTMYLDFLRYDKVIVASNPKQERQAMIVNAQSYKNDLVPEYSNEELHICPYVCSEQTNIEREVEQEDDGFTGLLEAITAHAHNIDIGIHTATVSASLVSIGCQCYVIACTDWSTTVTSVKVAQIAAVSASIVSAAGNIYSALNVAMDPSLLSPVLKRMLLGHVQRQSSAGRIYQRVLKLIVAGLVTAGFKAFGKELADIGSAIRGADALLAEFDGTIGTFEKWIRGDDDASKLTEYATRVFDNNTQLIANPIGMFVRLDHANAVDKQIKENTELASKLDKLIRNGDDDMKGVAKHLYATLNTIATALNNRRTEAATIGAMNQVIRPEPVAINIWGPPGHGKTYFVKNVLVPWLNQKFSLNGKVVHATATGEKYAPPISDEEILVIDEFLATGTNDPNVGMFNALMSAGPMNLDSAFVKNQQPYFRFVITISNVDPATFTLVGNNFTKAYEDAFRSRLMSIHFENTGFNPNLNRYQQTNFSNKFTIGGKQTGLGDIYRTLVNRYKQFDKQYQDSIDRAMQTIAAKQKQQAVGDPVTISFNGPPAAGKTYLSEDICRSYAKLLKIQFVVVGEDFKKQPFPALYLLNDLVVDNQVAFIQFYDSLGPRDVIISTNNLEFKHYYPYRLTTMLKGLTFDHYIYSDQIKHHGVYRRLGVSKPYWHDGVGHVVEKAGLCYTMFNFVPKLYGDNRTRDEVFREIADLIQENNKDAVQIIRTKVLPEVTNPSLDVKLSEVSKERAIAAYTGFGARGDYVVLRNGLTPNVLDQLFKEQQGVEPSLTALLATLKYSALRMPGLHMKIEVPGFSVVVKDHVYIKADTEEEGVIIETVDNAIRLNFQGSDRLFDVPSIHAILNGAGFNVPHYWSLPPDVQMSVHDKCTEFSTSSAYLRYISITAKMTNFEAIQYRTTAFAKQVIHWMKEHKFLVVIGALTALVTIIKSQKSAKVATNDTFDGYCTIVEDQMLITHSGNQHLRIYKCQCGKWNCIEHYQGNSLPSSAEDEVKIKKKRVEQDREVVKPKLMTWDDVAATRPVRAWEPIEGLPADHWQSKHQAIRSFQPMTKAKDQDLQNTIERVSEATCMVVSNATGLKARGMFIAKNFVLCNTHLFAPNSIETAKVYDDSNTAGWNARVFGSLKDRDLTILKITDANFPAKKSILASFIKDEDLLSFNEVRLLIVEPSTTTIMGGKTVLQSRLISNTGIADIAYTRDNPNGPKHHAALSVYWAGLNSVPTTDGTCGSAYLSANPRHGNRRIAGIHCLAIMAAQTTKAAICTQEDLQVLMSEENERLQADRERPFFATHAHDPALLGQFVDHSHPCDKCSATFHHAHVIKSEKESQESFQHLCKKCRKVDRAEHMTKSFAIEPFIHPLDPTGMYVVSEPEITLLNGLTQNKLFDIKNSQRFFQLGYNPAAFRPSYNKPDHIQSPFSSVVPFENDTINAPTSVSDVLPEHRHKLSTRDNKAHLLASQLGYLSYEPFPMSDKTLRAVEDFVYDKYLEIFSDWKPLNDHEIKNGVTNMSSPLYGYLNGLDGDKSAGFYGTSQGKIHKGDYFEKVPAGNGYNYKWTNTPHSIRLRERFEAMCKLAETGVTLLDTIEARAKMELLPKKKVQEDGKVRLFENIGIASFLFHKKYNGAFVALANKHRLTKGSNFTIGMNPYTETVVLYEQLLSVSSTGEDGDFTRYDKRIPLQVQILANRLKARWASAAQPGDVNYFNIFDVLCKQNSRDLHVCEGVYYLTNGSFNSGCLETNLDDGLFNIIMKYYCMLEIARRVPEMTRENDMITLANLERLTRFFVNGDDIITAIHPSVQVYINFNSMKEEYAKFGVLYDLPSKDGAASTGIIPIKDMSFSSRSFNFVNETLVFGALKKSSIERLFHWCKSKEPEQLVQNLNCALTEAFFHGKSYYDAICKIVLLCRKYYLEQFENRLNIQVLSYRNQFDHLVTGGVALEWLPTNFLNQEETYDFSYQAFNPAMNFFNEADCAHCANKSSNKRAHFKHMANSHPGSAQIIPCANPICTFSGALADFAQHHCEFAGPFNCLDCQQHFEFYEKAAQHHRSVHAKNRVALADYFQKLHPSINTRKVERRQQAAKTQIEFRSGMSLPLEQHRNESLSDNTFQESRDETGRFSLNTLMDALVKDSGAVAPPQAFLQLLAAATAERVDIAYTSTVSPPGEPIPTTRPYTLYNKNGVRSIVPNTPLQGTYLTFPEYAKMNHHGIYIRWENFDRVKQKLLCQLLEVDPSSSTRQAMKSPANPMAGMTSVATASSTGGTATLGVNNISPVDIQIIKDNPTATLAMGGNAIELTQAPPEPGILTGPPAELIALSGPRVIYEDLVHRNPYNVTTGVIDTSMAKNTLLFEIPYGTGLGPELTQYIQAHNICAGSFDYTFTFHCNFASSAAVMVGWLPRKIVNPTINDLNPYGPTTFALNEYTTKCITMHDRRIGDFWRETASLFDPTQEELDSRPRLVGIVAAALTSFTGEQGPTIQYDVWSKANANFLVNNFTGFKSSAVGGELHLKDYMNGTPAISTDSRRQPVPAKFTGHIFPSCGFVDQANTELPSVNILNGANYCFVEDSLNLGTQKHFIIAAGAIPLFATPMYTFYEGTVDSNTMFTVPFTQNYRKLQRAGPVDLSDFTVAPYGTVLVDTAVPFTDDKGMINNLRVIRYMDSSRTVLQGVLFVCRIPDNIGFDSFEMSFRVDSGDLQVGAFYGATTACPSNYANTIFTYVPDREFASYADYPIGQKSASNDTIFTAMEAFARARGVTSNLCSFEMKDNNLNVGPILFDISKRFLYLNTDQVNGYKTAENLILYNPTFHSGTNLAQNSIALTPRGPNLKDSVRNELMKLLGQMGIGEKQQGNMLPILGGFAKGGGEAASVLFQQQFTQKMAELGFSQNMALQNASFASKGLLQQEYLKLAQKNALELEQLKINTDNRLARSNQLQNNALYHELPKNRDDYSELYSTQEHDQKRHAEEVQEQAFNDARIQQHLDYQPKTASIVNYGATSATGNVRELGTPDYDNEETYHETRPIDIPPAPKHDPHSAIFDFQEIEQRIADKRKQNGVVTGKPPRALKIRAVVGSENVQHDKHARMAKIDDAWKSATVAQKKKEHMDRLDSAWRHPGPNGPSHTLSQFTGGISKA